MQIDEEDEEALGVMARALHSIPTPHALLVWINGLIVSLIMDWAASVAFVRVVRP